jgi:hypothetical protein
MSRRVPHIAVDLDGTLAEYDGVWRGVEHIGKPVPRIVEKVKAALAKGYKVSIFTARVAGLLDGEFGDSGEAKAYVEEWCLKHLGVQLEVTAIKHGSFSEFWDDRAVRVKHNEGINVYGGPLWDELEPHS